MLARARERFPDRTFADLDATEPIEGAASLDDAIEEILEEATSKNKDYEEQNSRLAQLLVKDPTSARFIKKWVDTGDPRTAIVELFGDDLGMSEESRGKFKEQLDGWSKRKAENDALDAEYDTNWQQSLKDVISWGESKGLSFDQQRDVMVRLLAIVSNGIIGKYTAEDFDLAYNAIRHDSDVAAARAEGEVAGRNAKIAAARRDRSLAGAMPPSASGGQGGSAAEKTPQPAKKSIWTGIR